MCINKLMQCKFKTGKSSFSEIAIEALGIKGKYATDCALICSQVGFTTAYIYFISATLKDVVYDISGGIFVNRWWFGKI